MPNGSSASVAQPSQEVIPQKKNNPRYYNIVINELLLLIRTTHGLLAPKQVAGFFQGMKKNGLLSPQLLSIYYYITVERTATRQRIVEDLEFTESVVYKLVAQLVEKGFIKKAGKVAGHAKGGHKPDLYATLDVTPQEIVDARIKEEERLIPGLVLCKRITQFLLTEWIPDTPTPNEITAATMKRIVGYNFDISTYNKKAMYEIIMRNVQQTGVKVWR